MSTFRWWAFWRRVQYGAGTMAFLVLVGGLIYRVYFYAPASCFDGMQNGAEFGIDCGGACVRICAAQTVPPKVLWAQSFEIVPGQYNAVAYIENTNQIAATKSMRYRFEFYAGSEKIKEVSGTTVLPANSIYPVFEGRVMTDGKKITETKLILEPAEVWQPGTIGREQFKSSDVRLTNTDVRPRLDVTIENTQLTKAEQIEIVATLFNEAGKPITASQTFVESLDGRAKKNIVFTWPASIAKTVRSCSVPTDIVVGIDLSGSMNNDGDNPPQPVTDALAAAKSFVQELKDSDQAAVVTFANDATTNVSLTSNHMTTAEAVGQLVISKEAETGYTNTVAALKAANSELSSERHSAEARRVLVLLTDGLPTAPDDSYNIVEEAKKIAGEISQSGVTIYSIGLGKGVDATFTKSLASSPESAFYAPSTEQLSGIYKTITASLCESGAAKIEVIAKTPTNFTPLR
jgi:Mg-chelatase subunit ChlD